jgi:hypothetical protein
MVVAMIRKYILLVAAILGGVLMFMGLNDLMHSGFLLPACAMMVGYSLIVGAFQKIMDLHWIGE